MNRCILGMCFVLLAAACLPFAAFSAINKCVGADGKVVFSDQPCSTGQAATQIKAPAKPATQSNNPTGGSDQSSQGDGPNVQVYDTLCAEDQRLFDRDSGKLSKEDAGLRKARLDKRCNPQARQEAAEKDRESMVLVCIERREVLKRQKSAPKPPPGYGDRSDEMAATEKWLKANCK
jgi:Domain of unknown function (DUF4124)